MAIDDVTEALATGRLDVCPSPIFIIGCPRSGTTALARALGEHSQLWTSHESYFLNGLFGDGRPAKVHRRQRARDAPGWLITEDVDRAEFLAYVGAGLNALYTSRSGGRRWIDQTPMYTLFAADLAELFPGAVFLHMLRDGRDVVESMMHFRAKFEDRPQARRHIPGWAADFDASCRTWTEYVTHAAGFCVDHPDRTHTVGNSRVATDPAAAVADVCRFLGIHAEDGPVQRLSAKRVNSSYVGSAAAARSAAGASWTPPQRARFIELCGEAMIDLGLVDVADLERWQAANEPVRTGGR